MLSSVCSRGMSVDLGEEELEMTFQIALVGSDGLVVGSDRKMAYRTQEQNGKANWQFSDSDKFTQNTDGSIVCFFAGGPHAKSVADLVVTKCDPSQNLPEWHNSLRETAQTIRAHSQGDEIIVVRSQQRDVCLINKVGDAASLSPIDGARCTGVIAKCRFLVEAFWERASVQGLRHLALVAMQYAACERSESVGLGFNLLVLEDGNVKWEKYTENDDRILSICDQFQHQIRQSLCLEDR